MRFFIGYFIVCLIIIVDLKAQEIPKREMRAVWIATVNNIDWPSKSGLSTDIQQQELKGLLDLAKEYNLNSIVLQVRPATDAFFPSKLEPWSQWLSGKQGLAPDPIYDPLDFAIKECRKRGLDIHLWLNPYRAHVDTLKSVLCESHPYNTNNNLFVTYGNTRYFNPGLKETRDHVSHVVADLVRRYDFDAIHMDDYFYPYKIAGVDFRDDKAFIEFPRGFSADRKEDWRRDNVDLIIKQISDSIKSVKPYVEFGISPFGVWRNIARDSTGSKTKAGVTNYDDLYADVLKWQKKGWIDYVTPQLYWHIGMEAADYAILADWWGNNSYGCKLYIGQAWYRIDPGSKTASWQNADEIIRQIELNRKIPNIKGSMFFSAKSMKKNVTQLKEKLLSEHYKHKALPPVNDRTEEIVAQKPVNAFVEKRRKKVEITWNGGADNKYFVVYKIRKGKEADLNKPENIFQITGESKLIIEKSRNTNPDRYIYIVTALSITNHESDGIVCKKLKN